MNDPIVHLGDCRDHMRDVIRAGSVHCVVSSPPYWGLRDYGIPGSLWADGWFGVFGLEPTVQQYVAHTLELFEGIRRVLRDDGVVFWNIGDTYSQATKWGGTSGGKHRKSLHGTDARRQRKNLELANGNKLMVPHRVAIALQDAGWCVRQDIVWAKRSPMPESLSGWRWMRCRVKVGTALRAATGTYHACATPYRPQGDRDGRDFASSSKWSPCPGCKKCESTGGYVLRRGSWRPTNGHEYILMVTKPGEYFCDGDAAAEVAVGGTPGNKNHKQKSEYDKGFREHRRATGLCELGAKETRNPRSVWTMSSEPYGGAHFATFPSELPFRCIKSATSSAGCCPTCGSQWAPVVETARVATRPGNDTKVGRVSVHDDSPYGEHTGRIVGNRDPQRHCTAINVTGYRPTCKCPPAEPVPATVYDLFTGSGTTLQVAYHMGRYAIGSEIGQQYLPLIHERIQKRPRCLITKQNHKRRGNKSESQQSLFAPVH